MRNLKKVLSLALALVMLLGMMVVGAGAATKFQDDDKIQNKEAVSVLVGLGVMKGREDGSNFAPTATLTRAEAAKMIAQLDLGVEAADALKANGNNTFSDVWTDHWAAGAIDYCVEQGYINGDGAGHFFPGRNVTGVQFASMLLRLLGYDAKIEELVGDQWAVKAAALARKAGLTTNVMANGEDMTRDGMAQMAFNALTAPMVEYEGMDITIGDVAINARVKIRTHTGSSIVSNSTYDYGEIKSNITPIRLCEERFPTLKLNRNDELDKFGRRCSVWKYKNLKIAGSENTIEPDLHYNTKVTDKTDPAEWAKMENLYAATNANGAITMQLWINGQNVTPTNQTVDSTSYAPGTRGWISYYTAPGREVEVYMNKDNLREVERVVVVDTVLGEVTKENADDTISVKLMKTPDNKVTTGSVTLNTKEGVGNVKKGDLVLVQGYNAADGGVKLGKGTTITSVEPATVVTGFATLKGYDSATKASYITVDGEKYVDAYSVARDFAIDNFHLNDEGYDCTLYLDQYGYIMKAIEGKDPNLVNDNLVAVKESYRTLVDGKIVTMVKGVISNGQTVTWQVENAVENVPANSIYTWSEPNGKRTLKPIADIAYEGQEKAETNANVATVKAGAISFKASDVFGKDKAQTVMYSSNVKFIFVGSSGVSVLTGRQTYNLEAGKTVAQAFKDGEITAVFIGTDPDVVDVSELIYVHSIYRETDEVVDVDGKQVLYHGYKAYASNGDEIEHFLGTKTTMADQFFKTAKTDDGKAWKPEGGDSKTVTEHTMTSAVVAKKAGASGDAWANNEDAFVLVDSVKGDHYDFLGSKSTKVVDLSTSKLYIESVAEINEAVKDGYYVEVAVIYNASDAEAREPSVGNVRVPVTIFVTDAVKADDDHVVPPHTPNGGGSSTSGTYTVESNTTGIKALEFAVVGTTDPTAVPAEPDWQGKVTANENDWVIVRAASGDKITTSTGLTAGDILNKDTLKTSTVTGLAEISTTGVWKFKMAKENLIVIDVDVDTPSISRVSIAPDATQVNVLMASGTYAANDTQSAKYVKAAAVAAYINNSTDLGGWTARVNPNGFEAGTGKADANGIILTKNGVDATVTDTTMKVNDSTNLATATINKKVYVLNNKSTTATLEDALKLAGVSMAGSSGYTWIKCTAADGTTITAVADNGLSATVTTGNVYDTNGSAGYIKLAGTLTTAVTGTAVVTGINGALTGNPTVALKAPAADDSFALTADSTLFVKPGATLTVTVKNSKDEKVATGKDLKAQITFNASDTDAATINGDYKTAAKIAGEGVDFNQTPGIDLEFNLTAPTAAAMAKIEVTLTGVTAGS